MLAQHIYPAHEVGLSLLCLFHHGFADFLRDAWIQPGPGQTRVWMEKPAKGVHEGIGAHATEFGLSLDQQRAGTTARRGQRCREPCAAASCDDDVPFLSHGSLPLGWDCAVASWMNLCAFHFCESPSI